MCVIANWAQSISTVTIPLAPLQLDQLTKVDKWLRKILWDSSLPESDTKQTFEIHRSKGRLVFTDHSVKLLQGVREIFELTDVPEENEGSGNYVGDGKIILIGRNITGVDFAGSIQACLD